MRQVVVKIKNKRQLDARHEQLVGVYKAAFRPRYDGEVHMGDDLLVVADFGETSWDSHELAEHVVLGIGGIAHQRNMLGTHIVFTSVPDTFLGQMLDVADLHGIPLLFREKGVVKVLWPQSTDKRVRSAYESIEREKAVSCYDLCHDIDRSRRATVSVLDTLRGFGLVYTSCSKQHPAGPGRPYKLYSVIEGMAV